MVTARGRSRRVGDPARSRLPLATRFTIRYWIAIVAFAVVGLSSLAGMRATLDDVEHLTDRAVLASGQPGRVHRILEHGRAMERAGSTTSVRELQDLSNALSDEAKQLRSTQLDLAGVDPLTGRNRSSLPQPVDDLYFGSRQVDTRVSEFASRAEELARYSAPDESANRAPLVAQLDEASGQLIVDLETVAGLYAEDSARIVSAQRDSDLVSILLAGLVAALSVVVLFRPMGRSIRNETSNLEQAERLQRENNERQTFRNELTKALEVCEEESEVLDAAARAMGEVAPSNRAELLVHTADRTNLLRAVASPTAGPARCPVDTPSGCAALRAGQPMVYESSRMLNVCPKLPQHDGGPCAAVCVPLMFNGEALGVLHATGPENQVLGTPLTERFSVLGQITANRIGTMRITKATERLAARDSLTDLDNRRTLLSKAAALLTDHRRFSLAVADLDHFKDLNDTYGHETGDRALQVFAECLRLHLRPEDIVARWGGEEFVVLLPDTPIDAATIAIERLQIALGDEIDARGGVPFTASWGLTDSGSAPTFQEMLNVADLAMYEAKRAGRDCLVVDAEAARRHEEAVATAAAAATPASPDPTEPA